MLDQDGPFLQGRVDAINVYNVKDFFKKSPRRAIVFLSLLLLFVQSVFIPSSFNGCVSFFIIF